DLHEEDERRRGDAGGGDGKINARKAPPGSCAQRPRRGVEPLGKACEPCVDRGHAGGRETRGVAPEERKERKRGAETADPSRFARGGEERERAHGDDRAWGRIAHRRGEQRELSNAA